MAPVWAWIVAAATAVGTFLWGLRFLRLAFYILGSICIGLVAIVALNWCGSNSPGNAQTPPPTPAVVNTPGVTGGGVTAPTPQPAQTIAAPVNNAEIASARATTQAVQTAYAQQRATLEAVQSQVAQGQGQGPAAAPSPGPASTPRPIAPPAATPSTGSGTPANLQVTTSPVFDSSERPVSSKKTFYWTFNIQNLGGTPIQVTRYQALYTASNGPGGYSHGPNGEIEDKPFTVPANSSQAIRVGYTMQEDKMPVDVRVEKFTVWFDGSPKEGRILAQNLGPFRFTSEVQAPSSTPPPGSAPSASTPSPRGDGSPGRLVLSESMPTLNSSAAGSDKRDFIFTFKVKNDGGTPLRLQRHRALFTYQGNNYSHTPNGNQLSATVTLQPGETTNLSPGYTAQLRHLPGKLRITEYRVWYEGGPPEGVVLASNLDFDLARN